MKHILIVVDMQTDFVDGALGTPEAVAILENVTANGTVTVAPEILDAAG